MVRAHMHRRVYKTIEAYVALLDVLPLVVKGHMIDQKLNNIFL